jgi:hypothetical protein
MSDETAAVARLIAAAIAYTDAVRFGSGPSHQRDLFAAVDHYRMVRGGLSAARDEFLARYPTSAALDDAVTLHTSGLGQPAYIGRLWSDDADDTAMSRAERIPGSWVLPGGTVCCPRHIDGCPPDGHPDAHPVSG